MTKQLELNPHRILTKYSRARRSGTGAPAAIHTPDSGTVDPQSFMKRMFDEQARQFGELIDSKIAGVLTERIGTSIEAAQLRLTERDIDKQKADREASKASFSKRDALTGRVEADNELLAVEIDFTARRMLNRTASPESLVAALKATKNEDGTKRYTERQIEYAERSFRADSEADGGVFIPEQIANKIVEYRKEALVPYRRANVMPLDKGSMKFPKQNSMPVVQWVGEQVAATATKAALGSQTMSLRKLSGMMVFSNEFLQQIGNGREYFLRQLQRAAAHEQQSAFYFGVGSEYRPNGIYNQTLAAMKVARTKAGAASTYAEIIADLIKMQVRMASDYADGNGNFDLSQAFWLMNHVTRGGLLATVDGSGQYRFLAEMIKGGEILGCGFDVTDAVPRTTTAGGAALTGGALSIMGLIDYSQITYGEGRNVSVKVADQATVVDSSGQTINLFTQDSSALVMFTEQDQLLHYSRAASWLTDIDWMSI